MAIEARAELDYDHVVRLNVSWSVYAALVEELGDHSRVRLTYDGENLEIMSPGSKHELVANIISDLIALARVEWSIDLTNFGSTTFKNEPNGGFEADKAYYLEARRRIRDRENIDLTIDPPPDLIVEVDITSQSDRRFDIYAALGIPEVWRYKRDRFALLTLVDGTYTEMQTSRIIGGLPSIEIGTRIDRITKSDSSDVTILADWQRWLRENEHVHTTD